MCKVYRPAGILSRVRSSGKPLELRLRLCSEENKARGVICAGRAHTSQPCRNGDVAMVQG
jgi:hypothetical protein